MLIGNYFICVVIIIKINASYTNLDSMSAVLTLPSTQINEYDGVLNSF